MSTKNDNIEEINSSAKIEKVEMPIKAEKMEEMPTHNKNTVYSGFAMWAKLYAILGFIGAGFFILFSIPYILALGVGLLMITAGVFYIIAYNKVLQASSLVAQLENQEGKEFKQTTSEVISNLKSYFKIISIINIVSIVSSIIFVIIFFVFFAAAISSIIPSVKNDPSLLPTTTSTINYK